MTTYYIVPQALYASTDWQASACCNVAPCKITGGAFAGAYAVNTAIFDSDPCFEKFRTTLEALETAEITTEEFETTEKENA